MTSRAQRTVVVWLVGTAVVAVLAACSTDRLLDVNAVDRVDASTLAKPENAQLLVNSAVGDFECALGSAITVEAIISDELADAQLGAAAWPYDRRDANTQPGGIYGTSGCANNQNPGIYLPLSTARWEADTVLARLQSWTDAEVPNRQRLIAQTALYAGFSYALLGMSMCEAAFDLGPQVNQMGMFALAEQRFSTAITAATAAGTSASTFLNAAYVGRARVRLFQGNKTGAAADAVLVPSGFALSAATAGAEDGRRYNRIFATTGGLTGNYTVEEQSRDLRTEGVVDPRSAVLVTTARPNDNVSLIVQPAKYNAYTSPIPVARYVEAQLILAEVQGGTAAVNIINTLRDAVSLPHYTGATDATSIQNLIIAERRRALFVEGFRNYDMQRFDVPFNPPKDALFPIKGGTYGDTRCLPLPDIERFNNPNIH